MENDDRIHKVYKLIFPDEYIYIGQTERTVETRYKNGFGYYGSPTIRDKIKYYKAIYGKDFRPEMIILKDNLTQTEADRTEQYYIAYYRELVGWEKVLNEDSGGSFGKTHSNATKEKISKARKRFLKENPDALKNATESKYKSICQYDIDGNYIATFSSVIEASQCTGISRLGIYACLGERNILAGGYRWYYNDGKHRPILQYPTNTNIPKQIKQIDIHTGKTIAKFPSIGEASRQTNIAQANITACLHNRRREAGGYSWKWAD